MSITRNSSLLGKIPVFAVVLAIAGITSGKVIFVDDSASGANNGSSWADAYNLPQAALTFAESGDEIRVGQGIYRSIFYIPPPPLTGDSDDYDTAATDVKRTCTFQLINGVVIKGGYAGLGEPDPNARDITLYETILSGDLNGDDEPNFVNNDENSYHVVTGSGTDETAVIDGFTITAGNADSDLSYHDGGGIYNSSGSPTVTNCTFNGNNALYGGGMFNNQNSNPTVTNCTFNNNTAIYGGGMYNRESNSPTVTNCTFSGNSATSHGGGMYNRDSSSPTVTNCTFSGNSANSYGGGMYNRVSSNPTVTNCRFSENSADVDGGGMYNYDNSPTVTNCTFSGNSAIGNDGGAINNSYSYPTITNCTFSENSAYDWGGAVQNINNSSPTFTNCVFIGNLADDGGGMYNGSDSNTIVTNCTFSENSANSYGGGMCNGYNSSATVSNCIVWFNTAPNGPQMTSTSTVSYSNVEEGWEGEGNIDAYPFFADTGYWDSNGTPEDANDDTWIDGDYHLKSEAGRWDANSESWIEDNVTSPCIDAGDPNSDWSAELWPHGEHINMGAYGGTPEASMSGNIADFNIDGVVDGRDTKLLIDNWLYEALLLPEDLSRDGIVNFTDFSIFARILGLPSPASDPNPTDGATGVSRTADLNWIAGDGATSHDVYFGTSNPPTFIGNQSLTTFDPGEMAYSTTYYWRIDEVGVYGTTTGKVWNFMAELIPPPLLPL